LWWPAKRRIINVNAVSVSLFLLLFVVVVGDSFSFTVFLLFDGYAAAAFPEEIYHIM
jgi:hypothetical protein